MLAFVPVLTRHSSFLSSLAQHETITQTDKPNKINGKHCMHASNIDIVQMKFHGGWPLLGELGLVYWSTPKRIHILWYGHNFLCTFVLFFTLSPSFYDYLVEIYGNMKASHTSQSNRIREFEMVLNFIWKYQISWTHISFFWKNVHEIEHRSFIIIFVCLCKFRFFIEFRFVNFFSLFLYEIAFCRFECFFYLHSIY